MLPILILGAVLLTVIFLYRSRNVGYWDARGVPMGKGCHWFFGHYKEMLLSTKHCCLKFDEIYNGFPAAPFVGYLKLGQPGLLLRDPDLVRAVLQTHFHHFAKHDIYVDRSVDNLLGSHPFNLSGEEWQAGRRRLTRLFSGARLARACPALLAAAGQMLAHLGELCADTGAATVEAKTLAGKLTTDVLATVFCGAQSNSFLEPGALFAGLTGQVQRGTVPDNLNNMLVFLFPRLTWLLRLRFASRRTEKVLLALTRRIISERMESKEARSDIFQEVVDQRLNGRDDAPALTDEGVAGVLYALVIDVYETSSIVIAYTLFELAWHPVIQDKLRTEIAALVDRTEGNFTSADINGLKYLHMVISESLRLHVPFAVMTLKCTADYAIPDHPLTIEQGTAIAISAHSLQRDARFYPEPLRFDPERFTDEAAARRHKFVYLPFGKGPRDCVGQRFGLLQSKVAVLKIIEHFQVDPSPKSGYPLGVDPKVFLQKRPLNGAWVQMRKLK